MKKLLIIALTLVLSIGLITINNTNSVEAKDNYLTFTAEQNVSSVTPRFYSGSNLQYRTYDNSEDLWSDWIDRDIDSTVAIPLDEGDILQLKGIGCTTDGTHHFSMTGLISASGDVTSLTNGVGGDATLTSKCYLQMFCECSQLTTAPNLPSTTLANGCYYCMFNKCSSLETAPVLPATTLCNQCYYMMFNLCTSLTTAPSLPATTLYSQCYYAMFNGCSSLNVYDAGTNTISGQTKIFTCPNLLTEEVKYMFNGCAGSTITPVAGHNYYIYTNYLTFKAVELSYNEILKQDVAMILPRFETGSYKFSMDGGVTWSDGDNSTIIALDDIDDYVMLKGTNCITDYSYHFAMTGKISASGDVTSLTNGVGGHVDLSTCYTGVADNCYAYMFSGCEKLVSIDNLKLPSTTLDEGCYSYMFENCKSLTSIPSKFLPATTLTSACYQNMFKGCTGLITIPANLLPAASVTDGCYAYMFYGCTGLITIPTNLLSAENIYQHCYRYMFYGCTNLTNLPNLPATVLCDDCYESMFENCSKIKLSEVETEEYGIPFAINASYSDGALEYMFDGTGGTFTGPLNVNTTYYLYGTLPTTTSSSDSVDTTCEAVIGPRWHWNDAKGICELEGYSVINTATK